MQPTNLNLKAIARDAALRGDTDLLERVVPIATFMDFCRTPRGILQHVAPPAGSRRGILATARSCGLPAGGVPTTPQNSPARPRPRVCNRNPTGIGREPTEGAGVTVISRGILSYAPVRRLSRAVAPDSNLLALRRGQGLDVSCFCHIIRKFCPAP